MVCKKCGKELAEGAKKCDGCGKKVTVKFKDLPKKQKITRIVIGCVCLLIAAIMMVGDGIGGASRTSDYDSAYINVVKTGGFFNYPGEAIGEAFEDFFSNPEWETFTSEDGDTIVEFNGRCYLYDEKVNCCIQFTVYDDGTFETSYADLDGDSLTQYEINELYEVIFE